MDIRIVEDNTEEALKELERKAYTWLVAVGKTAERYAKSNAPVRTGRLRDSITYKVEGDSVTLTSDVEYAIYQEYGTIYITGKHFMRNAMTNHIAEYAQLCQRILSQ